MLIERISVVNCSVEAIATVTDSAGQSMPIISRFLGIIITMYWNDHAPPHFHAKYGEYKITVDIHTGVVTGRFPKRALKHVIEWYELNKNELLENWELCTQNEFPKTIKPLE